MARILQEIIVPTVQFLGEALIQNTKVALNPVGSKVVSAGKGSVSDLVKTYHGAVSGWDSEVEKGEQVLKEVLADIDVQATRISSVSAIAEPRISRTDNSSSDGSGPAELHKKDDSGLLTIDENAEYPVGVLTRALSNVTVPREMKAGPTVECLNSMCKVRFIYITKYLLMISKNRFICF
jgi:hypothetical protein